MDAALRERAKHIPSDAGVYLHKNRLGKVIYVGKAANLRSRVNSYLFVNASNPPRLNDLIDEIADIEYVVTNSEQDALLLENTLIKKYSPKYNIRLKDGKSYPYIKVDMREDFPRIYITRNRSDSKALFFGPYATGQNVRRTLNLINKLFPYRSCTKTITGKDERPCLEYHIKRCCAPCTGYASKAEYSEVVKQVVNFLQYGPKQVIKDLKQEMQKAVELLEYERAGVLRDRIADINKLLERRAVAGVGENSLDAIAIASNGINAWAEIFFYRDGILKNREQFTLEAVSGASLSRLLSEFIKQYYGMTSSVPSKIICPAEVEDAEVIEQWLYTKNGRNVRIQVPKRGHKLQLLRMVSRNATLARDLADLNQKDASAAQKSMELLQEFLSLPTLPKRIECYDISHIQGAFVVASMVVFKDGVPLKKDYRRFKFELDRRVNDDFWAVRQVLSRRLKYLQNPTANEQSSFSNKPDLLLVDGGKGQLTSAEEALLNSGVEGINLATIAKKEELLHLPDFQEPVRIPLNSPAMFLLQRIRDEAHRFAVTYHGNRRSKASLSSKLDAVPGVGPKRRKELIKRFGSLAGIRRAPVSEIEKVPGITSTIAVQLKELF